jgi:Tfp pilus assembly protein PilE
LTVILQPDYFQYPPLVAPVKAGFSLIRFLSCVAIMVAAVIALVISGTFSFRVQKSESIASFPMSLKTASFRSGFGWDF